MNAGAADASVSAAATLFADSLVASAGARLPVVGMSMAPLLVPGDEIELEARGDRELRGGEILLLAPRDPRGAVAGFVVHRLIRVTRRGLLVRGDGARSADPSWPDECAIAVVRARWRDGVRTELLAGCGRAPWRNRIAGRIPASLKRLILPLSLRLRPREPLRRS